VAATAQRARASGHALADEITRLLPSASTRAVKLVSCSITGLLVADAALFGILAWQPALAPPIFRDFRRHFHAPEIAALPSATPATTAAAVNLWSSLPIDDLPALADRLRAAGFPPYVIREILRTRVNARYNSRIAALLEPDPNTPFWKTPIYPEDDLRRREAIDKLNYEQTKAVRDLLAGDSFAIPEVTADERQRFGSLPRTKIDALRRIEEDYSELATQVRRAMNGITLPEDREQLALLNREMQADLAAALTPEEAADYTMRSSAITAILRNQLKTFDPSEGEFRAIFQLQQAFSDKFPADLNGAMLPHNFEQQQAAQKELETQLKAALGDTRYADYSRAWDQEFQQLNQVAQRDHISAEIVLQAYNVRDGVAHESGRIFEDASLSLDQKRAALQLLAQTTRTQLLAMLGPMSGPAYVKIADNWLTPVEQGQAVSFSPGGGTSGTTNWSGVAATVSTNGSQPNFRFLPKPRPSPHP
jgi:hypothetical protein